MNVTTLNTTTLDGGVIIKKGGGGTPTPPSGGESGGSNWELTYYKIVDANEQMMQGLFLYGGTNIVNCAIKSSNEVIANAGAFVAFTAINDGRSNEILAIVSAKLPILVDGEYKPTSLKEFFVGTGLWDAISPMLLEITEAEYYNLE